MNNIDSEIDNIYPVIDTRVDTITKQLNVSLIYKEY